MLPDELYKNILCNLTDGVYFVDQERKIQFWNKAAEEISGYTWEDIVGKACGDNLLNHVDREGNCLCIKGCPLHDTLQSGQRHEAKLFLQHKKGHRIPVDVKIFPIYESGKIAGAAEIFTDSSSRLHEENLLNILTKMAMTDQLTGLSNRRHTEHFLEEKILEQKRFGTRYCLVFIDLDDLDRCNRLHGHEAGETLIAAITSTFRHNVRETDMMGRWGGEEFVGVFEIKEDGDARVIVEKLRMLIEGTSVKLNNQSLHVTASIGATIIRSSDTPDSVVYRADRLMFRSKERSNCVTLDPELRRGEPDNEDA